MLRMARMDTCVEILEKGGGGKRKGALLFSPTVVIAQFIPLYKKLRVVY